MKTKLLFVFTAVLLFMIPNGMFGKAINLGTAADFAVFSTDGSVSNTGISQVTGNVGSNNGSKRKKVSIEHQGQGADC